jgi:hypothetical protein
MPKKKKIWKKKVILEKKTKTNEKVKKKRGMHCVSLHHLVVACVLLRAYRNNIYDGIIIVN